MTPLMFAGFFALIVGALCLYAYVQTNNDVQLILSLINFGMAVVDFTVVIVNLLSTNC